MPLSVVYSVRMQGMQTTVTPCLLGLQVVRVPEGQFQGTKVRPKLFFWALLSLLHHTCI